MMDWKGIDTVFLDMDGTLLDLNFDNHFWQELVPQRYAVRHGLNPQQARELLKPRFRAMEGRIEWYCLDYWSTQLHLDIRGLKGEIADLIAVLPHATEFLEAARHAGKRLILLTNAHPHSLAIKLERTCLERYFDTIISSHGLGLPKEAAEFWPMLSRRVPFEPLRSLLVDDSLAVLRSAQGYGIAHLRAVRKPDSRQAARTVRDFPAIHDFRELLPITP